MYVVLGGGGGDDADAADTGSTVIIIVVIVIIATVLPISNRPWLAFSIRGSIQEGWWGLGDDVVDTPDTADNNDDNGVSSSIQVACTGRIVVRDETNGNERGEKDCVGRACASRTSINSDGDHRDDGIAVRDVVVISA